MTSVIKNFWIFSFFFFSSFKKDAKTLRKILLAMKSHDVDEMLRNRFSRYVTLLVSLGDRAKCDTRGW